MRYFIFISFLIGFCLSLVGQDTVHLDLPTQNVEQGENIAVDVVVAGFENVVGAQFTMKYDKEVINYLDVDNFGIASINKNNNFGIPADENGVISFLWYDFLAQGVSLEDGTTLFTVHFVAIGSNGEYSDIVLDTSSNILNIIEISNADGEVLPFEITDGKVTIGTSNVTDLNTIGIEVAEVIPNVVNDQAFVRLTASNRQEISYQVLNVGGQVESSGVMDLLPGEQMLKLDSSNLPNAKGTYFIEFAFGNNKTVRKFIKM